MLSAAKSAPPSNKRIPNTRYHLMNETLRSGANLSNRCDPHFLAAVSGEVTTNVPSAMATALTRTLAVVSPTVESASGGAIPSFWEYPRGSTIHRQAPGTRQQYPRSGWPEPAQD